MSARDDLHRLLDEIPDVHLASLRTYLSELAQKPWDVYFAGLPVGDETFTDEERVGLVGELVSDSSKISLEDLRRELEQA